MICEWCFAFAVKRIVSEHTAARGGVAAIAGRQTVDSGAAHVAQHFERRAEKARVTLLGYLRHRQRGGDTTAYLLERQEAARCTESHTGLAHGVGPIGGECYHAARTERA